MIHVNDPDFNEHLFRENFNMHTSTSPQYSMIASLDVARKQAVMEGYKLLSRTLRAGEGSCASRSTPPSVFRVLELEDLLPEEVRTTASSSIPTKVTVDISGCGYTVEELQKELFERYNIQVEKSTFNTLTLLLTIGTTRCKVSRLYDALMRIAREGRAPRRLVPHARDSRRSRSCATCRATRTTAAASWCRCSTSRTSSTGSSPAGSAADQIVPYPPGIPVLVPGPGHHARRSWSTSPSLLRSPQAHGAARHRPRGLHALRARAASRQRSAALAAALGRSAATHRTCA